MAVRPRRRSFAACATQELKRSEIAQRLMRAHGVVDALPGAGLTIEGGDAEVAERAQFIELLGMRALGALDRAVESGRARRQHEQAPTAALAGGLEGGAELR